VQQHAVSQTAGPVAFRERRTASTVIFTLVTLLWVLAIVVSVSANSSNAVGAIVFFGIFLLITLAGWYVTAGGRARLEISGETIVYQKGRRGMPVTLSPVPGDDATLWVIPKTYHYGMAGPVLLALLGTGGFVPLNGVPVDKVTQRPSRARSIGIF
jgi:hypothetical protein